MLEVQTILQKVDVVSEWLSISKKVRLVMRPNENTNNNWL